MAQHKRGIDEVPDISEKELYQRLVFMEEPYRSYAAFTYLMGNRSSEGIGIKKYEKTGTYEYKRHTRRGGDKTVKIAKITYDKNKWKVAPLEHWRIQYDAKAGILSIKGIPTLKREENRRRDDFVLVNGPGERKFVKILFNYITNERRNGRTSTDSIWNFSRHRFYKAVRKHLAITPHKLRAMRATKEAITYGMDAIDLKEKHDWSDANMPMKYASKSKKNIIEKMKKNTEQ